MNTLFLSKEKVLNKVVEVAVEDIVPNPSQPRKYMSKAELMGLTESIRRSGVIQPILVRRLEDNYELIAGERRLRASKMAGLRTIPCIVTDTTERNSALFALLENVQRASLSFFDEAAAMKNLIETYGLTQEDIAVRLGKSQSAVANKLRLLQLSDEEKTEITRCMLTERHARALLRLPAGEQRMQAIARIERYALNVSATEKMVSELIEKDGERRSIEQRRGAFRDIRLFVNTINRAVEIMQAAGIAANATRKKYADYTEFTVIIPDIPKNVSRETI